ncbi:MAG: hypothetical protein ACTTJV_00195 [Ottowia sp.]
MRKQTKRRARMLAQLLFQIFHQGKTGTLQHRGCFFRAFFRMLHKLLSQSLHASHQLRRRILAHHFQRTHNLVQLLAHHAQRPAINRG